MENRQDKTATVKFKVVEGWDIKHSEEGKRLSVKYAEDTNILKEGQEYEKEINNSRFLSFGSGTGTDIDTEKVE
jgi:hypothetical protein